MGNSSEAEDVANRRFLEVWRHLDEYGTGNTGRTDLEMSFAGIQQSCGDHHELRRA